MAKKIFKKEQIIAAYNLIKTANLDKMATVKDRRLVSDAIVALRPIVNAYKEDKDTAEDTLCPGAMAEIERRVKDGANVTNLDVMRHTLLNNEYQKALKQYDAERLAEEVEVELNPIAQEHIDRILEGNPNWNAEQIMYFLDVLG